MEAPFLIITSLEQIYFTPFLCFNLYDFEDIKEASSNSWLQNKNLNAEKL